MSVINTAGSTAGVGECAVFAGAVVTDWVPADELFADGQLDVITNDGDLDLAASVGVAGPIVRPGERDVA